ncbi:flagellar hook protein FlgE [Sphingomonas sp. PB2P19]|uniref:flagellar hook protein FlgE n=1 Tax=Sphingomonas rhamnosi TaxID=3096156 RepID=UPI002FC86B0E
MTFYTSLSGLQAAQTDMSVIAHNIANVATNGFKKSQTTFADVIASNVALDPRHMVGSGVAVQANRQQFGEGSLTATSSALDLAISGDSFFSVKSPGAGGNVTYTRNGAFQVDSGRNIVDAQGSYLQVFPVDASGGVTGTTLTNVRLPETSGTPVSTANVTLATNLTSAAKSPATATFNRLDGSSYNNATATTIYDSAGNAQTMTSYFVRNPATASADGTTTQVNAWTMYTYVGDTAVTAGGAAGVPVTFDASGKIATPATAVALDAFTPAGGTAQTLALNLAGTTQNAAAFSVASRSQDGASVGKLQSVAVDDAGVISATFSNGDVQALGKVALANFTDPTGLRQQGDNYWAATGISGAPTLGASGDSGFGTVQSSMLEGSNVDITAELVALISAQRNFQANSKALDTQNKISQTIYNIQS